MTPMTNQKLGRAAGVSAVLAGLLYITIQFVHPVETVSAVTTSAWAIVHYLSLAMAVLGLAGVTGLYLRQVAETGLLGLIGFLLLATFFVMQAAFNFLEALVLPAIAQDAPDVVADILGIFGGAPADGSLGALEQVGLFAFLAYMLGGATFGIAIFRARVLPRWAGILLAAGALVTLAVPLFPHQVGRFAAVPVGLALAWLGYSLWAERRTSADTPRSSHASAQLDRAAAK